MEPSKAVAVCPGAPCSGFLLQALTLLVVVVVVHSNTGASLRAPAHGAGVRTRRATRAPRLHVHACVSVGGPLIALPVNLLRPSHSRPIVRPGWPIHGFVEAFNTRVATHAVQHMQLVDP